MRYIMILTLLLMGTGANAQCLVSYNNQADLEADSFALLAGQNMVSTTFGFDDLPTGIIGPELHPSDYVLMRALPGDENGDTGDNSARVCAGSKCLTAYPFFEQPEALEGTNYPDSPSFIVSEGAPMPGNAKAAFAGKIEFEFLNPVFALSMELGQTATLLPVQVDFFNLSGELLGSEVVQADCGYLAVRAIPGDGEPCWISRAVIQPTTIAPYSTVCYSLDEVFFIHFDSPVATSETTWGAIKAQYR